MVVDEASGKKIAAVERQVRDNAQCADPVIVGADLFVTTGYNVGSALVGISGTNATVIWKKGYGCVYATPVLVGDCLYALIESGWQKADLVCVTVKDGTEKWRLKDVGTGGLILAGGKLLILSRAGELILAEASPAAYKELARSKIFPEGAAGGSPKPAACWNGPVLSDGRVYARNEKGVLVCVDVSGK